MKYCKECNTSTVVDDDLYCYLCGKPLEDIEICMHCKKELSIYDKYCPKCGTKRGEK